MNGGGNGLTRRQALAAALVTGGQATIGTVRAPNAVAQRSVSGGGGIAGGGVAEVPDGEAQFSLFASTLKGEDGSVVFGKVQWVDPNWRSQGLALESTSVTSYGPPEDDPDARELRGTMKVNGEGNYPFVLRAVDVGPPGFEQDTIRLVVGPAADAGTPAATPVGDFAYSVDATITQGDLQLLSFDTPNQG